DAPAAAVVEGAVVVEVPANADDRPVRVRRLRGEDDGVSGKRRGGRVAEVGDRGAVLDGDGACEIRWIRTADTKLHGVGAGGFERVLGRRAASVVASAISVEVPVLGIVIRR